MDNLSEIIFELLDKVDKLENKIDDLEFKNTILEIKVAGLKDSLTLTRINLDQGDIAQDLKLSEVRDEIRELKRKRNILGL
ncbi:hypothetical protein ACJ2A9_04920 [Anaerobacillus sp. MEB173]|uniref:hypothetical protein n=1 Tax=Anaerobacillus sp. MEB173 TaxID=3383345 RepID=UPI003F91B269